MVLIDHLENFLVEWRAYCRLDLNVILGTYRLYLFSCFVELWFVHAHHLDRQSCLLDDAHSDFPLDDTETCFMLLTAINCVIENFGVEQVTSQHQGETMESSAHAISSFTLGGNQFICLPQLCDVSEVRGELSMACDHSSMNLCR